MAKKKCIYNIYNYNVAQFDYLYDKYNSYNGQMTMNENEYVYINTNVDPFMYKFRIWDRNIKQNSEQYNSIINELRDIFQQIFVFDPTKYIQQFVFHLRLGDRISNDAIEKFINDKNLIFNIDNYITHNDIKKFIILSDNTYALDYIKNTNQIFFNKQFNNNFGESKHFIKINNEKDFDNLMNDFFIIYYASGIVCYNNWSGFSFYATILSKNNNVYYTNIPKI